MKLKFTSVTVEEVKTSQSKKNTGGAYSKMKITATLTAAVRKAMGIGGDVEQWPPDGEKSGKLKGTFDTSNIILTRKQGSLVETLGEADIAVSLADSFSWKFRDPKSDTDTTTLITFWVRTDDLTAAQLMNEYFYSIQGGESTGMLNYNKGDGSRVDMTADPNQLTMGDDARKSVEEMPEGEGKAPTHAEKIKERKQESAKKAALKSVQ